MRKTINQDAHLLDGNLWRATPVAVLLAAGMNLPGNAVLGSLTENAPFHLSLHSRHYCSNDRNADTPIKGAQ